MSKIAMSGGAGGNGTVTIKPPSTDSTYDVTLPSRPGDIPVVNSSGVLESAAGAISPYSFKNKVINGDMMHDQRNSGAEVYPTGTGSKLFYLCDRFYIYTQKQSTVAAKRVISANTSPAGFKTYTHIYFKNAHPTPVLHDEVSFQQIIEDRYISDIALGTTSAKTVTLSFWVKTNRIGSHGLSLRNSNSIRSCPTSYNVTTAGVWEYKTVTFPGDESAQWLSESGVINICFGLLAHGSRKSSTNLQWMDGNYVGMINCVDIGTNINDYWMVTGVQLEIGSTATQYERRPPGLELMLCQRYYQKFDISDTDNRVPNLGTIYTTGNSYSFFKGLKNHPVVMRVTPSCKLTIDRGTGFTGLTNFSPYVYSDGMMYGVRLGNAGDVITTPDRSPYLYGIAEFDAEL